MAEIHIIISTEKDSGPSKSNDEILETLEEEIEALTLEVDGETTYNLKVRGIGTTRKNLDESKRLRDENRKAAKHS